MRGGYEISVPSLQFPCESKTTLNNKVLICFKKREKKLLLNTFLFTYTDDFDNGSM